MHDLNIFSHFIKNFISGPVIDGEKDIYKFNIGVSSFYVRAYIQT
jgi:hypothetical protein